MSREAVDQAALDYSNSLTEGQLRFARSQNTAEAMRYAFKAGWKAREEHTPSGITRPESVESVPERVETTNLDYQKGYSDGLLEAVYVIANQQGVSHWTEEDTMQLLKEKAAQSIQDTSPKSVSIDIDVNGVQQESARIVGCKTCEPRGVIDCPTHGEKAKSVLHLNEDMDANRWVREFREAVHKQPPNMILSDDFLRAWFANAIMAGYDNGVWKTQAAQSRPDTSLVERLRRFTKSHKGLWVGEEGSDEPANVAVPWPEFKALRDLVWPEEVAQHDNKEDEK